MNKLRYYILITRGIAQVKRHAKMWNGTYSQQITKDDVYYVINTRDMEFQAQAIEWLESEGIQYNTSESNGGPSKGKNAVLDAFLASDDDYCIQVDGDDMITPHGIHVHKMIANPTVYGLPDETPPDVVVLDYQYGIVPNEGYGPLSESENIYSAAQFAEDIYNADCIQGMGYRCFNRPWEWWDRAMRGEYFEKGSPYLRALSEAHKKLITYEFKYINKWETHCRVIWYSKKAAGLTRFKEDILVGEDVMNYFDLKHEFAQGNLTMKTLHELYPTYVYDQRVGGIVQIANDMNHGRGYLDWMEDAGDKYEEYEAAGKLHEDLEIPYLEFPTMFDEHEGVGYKPDTLGLVNYPATKVSIKHCGY